MRRSTTPQIWLWLIVTTVLVLLSLLGIAFRERILGNSLFPSTARRESSLSELPPIILWAWERPVNVNFIDPRKVAVAFLAKTLYLRGETVSARPRLQPLTVPYGTKLIAVARIESDRLEPPSLSTSQIEDARAEIVELSKLSSVVAVQLDFDAKLSERAFYRDLIFHVRKALPDSTALSITALASWCSGDNWMSDLPVDEAVPMLFRMGLERNQFIGQLEAGANFTSKPCLKSYGISTDVPITGLPDVERVYVFNPGVWSQDSVDRIMETYSR